MYFKKLQGENIFLSPISTDEAEKYTEWMNDLDLTEMIGGSNNVISLEKQKKWIESQSLNNEYCFSIIKKDTDELIGSCTLFKVNLINKVADLGIYIGEKKERHKGYGTEAINLILHYAFNYLNLENIMLTVLESNKEAISCYEKIGFKLIGKRRNAYTVCNKNINIVYMDILKNEFKYKAD